MKKTTKTTVKATNLKVLAASETIKALGGVADCDSSVN